MKHFLIVIRHLIKKKKGKAMRKAVWKSEEKDVDENLIITPVYDVHSFWCEEGAWILLSPLLHNLTEKVQKCWQNLLHKNWLFFYDFKHALS